MKSHKLTVQKTARYFVLGDAGPAIRHVWFICHGYGHLGNYFLKQFEPFQNEAVLFVSCEGLHRFYTNGFSGRVGASWMTKEDREDDIADYIVYLNQVYAEVMQGLDPVVQVTAFGFSQGTATVSRWVGAGSLKITRLVLWAGAFPNDVDLKLHKERFNQMSTILVAGTLDEFIKETDVHSLKERLDAEGIHYEMKRFEGKHELYAPILEALLAS
jgi:predicted esterase